MRKSVKPVSKTTGTIAGESCAIWDFNSPEREAEKLAAFVAAEMRTHDLGPRDLRCSFDKKAGRLREGARARLRGGGLPLRNEARQAGSIMLQELLAEEASEFIVSVLRLATAARAGRHWTECQEALGGLRGIGPDDEAEQTRFARELDAYAARLGRDHPSPPTSKAAARQLIDDVLAFLGRERSLRRIQPMPKATGSKR